MAEFSVSLNLCLSSLLVKKLSPSPRFALFFNSFLLPWSSVGAASFFNEFFLRIGTSSKSSPTEIALDFLRSLVSGLVPTFSYRESDFLSGG